MAITETVFPLRKNPEDNICNLCLQTFPCLSIDHVPPKCTGNKGRGVYENCFPSLHPSIPGQVFSDGVSYATICSNCNKLLSERYDPAISRLYKSILHSQNKKINLQIKLRPNAILRGIMGHFISAKTTHKMSVSDEVFRRCAKEPNELIPDNYHFYIIYYPYQSIRIVRDIMMIPNLHEDIHVVVNVVKIYPLSFVITDQPFLSKRFTDWNQYIGMNYKHEANVNISLNQTLSENIPEDDPKFSRILGLYADQSICTIETKENDHQLH